MDSKLAHQLAGLCRKPLFQVFLNVRKAYGSLYIGRCMDILMGYGLGHNLQMILQRYWENQVVVPKLGKYSRRPFGTERGVTQYGTVSLTIFNIFVDAVVRAVVLEVCRPQDRNHGLGWAVGVHNIIFYEDNGRIAGHNPIWVYMILTAAVRMFKRMGLLKNLGKTKAMV